MAEQVVLYTSDNCVPCEWVKRYLERKGVPFTALNVSHDERAREELEKLGFRATPITVVNGQTFTGFNQKRLEAALVAAGHLKAAPSA